MHCVRFVVLRSLRAMARPAYATLDDCGDEAYKWNFRPTAGVAGENASGTNNNRSDPTTRKVS